MHFVRLVGEIWFKHGLSPRDSIHAASVIQNAASSIVTNDDDFDFKEESLENWIG